MKPGPDNGAAGQKYEITLLTIIIGQTRENRMWRRGKYGELYDDLSIISFIRIRKLKHVKMRYGAGGKMENCMMISALRPSLGYEN